MKARTKSSRTKSSARAIQRRRNARTLARAIAAEERTIQRLIDNEGTVEISLSDYRKLIAGLSERGAIDAALRRIVALCDDGDADAMTRQAARIAKAAIMQRTTAPPAGTRHYIIQWSWDASSDGRRSFFDRSRPNPATGGWNRSRPERTRRRSRRYPSRCSLRG